MKKISIVLCALMLLMLCACNNSNTPENIDTLGMTLQNAFEEEAKTTTDPEAIAQALAGNTAIEFACDVAEVSEGYLPGFDSEINGFEKGYAFIPMIGSIPFVGYVLETNDAEALKTTLLEHADPRWNICTAADETVCAVSGNLVFFVMCSNEE